MKNIVWIFGLLFLSISCSTKQYEGKAEMPEQDYHIEETSAKQAQAPKILKERKIIKTADIRFQVKDINKSSDKIQEIARKYEGFISDMNQTSTTYAINNILSIRVPNDKFDNLIAELESESVYLDYKRISSQDVSEEYVDISSRLKTKKTVRDRYEDVLRNQAGTVEEVLNAEDKIRVIQEEIEVIEGRLRFLNDRISVSTVNLEMYQEVAYQKAPEVFKKSFSDKISEGFVSGWNFILNIIIGLVTVWPLVILGLLIFIFRHKWLKIFRK